MQIEVATLSNVGGRDTNEDASGVWSAPPNAIVCVVSDGAGGHGGGDIASKLVVTAALASLQQTPECSCDAVRRALAEADRAITEKQGLEPRLARMRATAVVFCCDAARRRAAWGHIGDSRLYYFRSRRIVLQTRDHSVVQNMVDAGYLRQGELRAAPERSLLFAALGEPRHCEPAVQEGAIDRGDMFLICTDGVWEHVTEPELERLLDHARTAADWLAEIEASVLRARREQQDNFSAIAVWCTESAESPQKPRPDAIETPP